MLKVKFIKDLLEKRGKIMGDTSREFVENNPNKELTVVSVKIEGCPYWFQGDEVEAVFEKNTQKDDGKKKDK